MKVLPKSIIWLLIVLSSLVYHSTNAFLLPSSPFHPKSSPLHAQSQSQSTSTILPPSAYQTILEGRIAVIPQFLPSSIVTELRHDAQSLYQQGHFSTDALAAYGKESTTQFDPTKDRTVLKLDSWNRSALGNYPLRHERFASIMSKLRTELSHQLHRPKLDQGVSTTKYGTGSTEISYTRFGPGAYLKRHIDEHHEECKGRRGWEKPTRRSISWLIYLNEEDWDETIHGGCLRCFERNVKPVTSGRIGSTMDGDLQIGWLRSEAHDNNPMERPVFLDARRPSTKGNCALYILRDDDTNDKDTPLYISQPFHADPILFLAGGDFFAQRLLIDNPTIASRFHFLEPPKSKLTEWVSPPKTPSEAQRDEFVMDVPPLGGTLVLFDSVSLPHEVLPSFGRERWATSGWFHEDQQEEMYHPPPVS